MQEAGLEEAEVYILQRQNTAVQYIVTLPIMDLCEEAMQSRGSKKLAETGGVRPGRGVGSGGGRG